jgi:hypothetical protein
MARLTNRLQFIPRQENRLHGDIRGRCQRREMAHLAPWPRLDFAIEMKLHIR